MTLPKRASLAGLMWALQEIGAAVSRNDRGAYLTAVRRARQIGCTEEQIADAYQFRSKTTNHLTFNRDGSLR